MTSSDLKLSKISGFNNKVKKIYSMFSDSFPQKKNSTPQFF